MSKVKVNALSDLEGLRSITVEDLIDNQDRILSYKNSIFESLKRSYAEAGYQLIGTFQDGCTITTATEVVLDWSDGSVYSWTGGLPHVVAPSTDPALPGSEYVPRTDDRLRSDLQAVDGDSIIGYATYAQIRSYAGDLKSIRCGGRDAIYSGDGAHGKFYRDDSDTTSTDNDGTILIDALGRRWKRKNSDEIDPRWFGVIYDNNDSLVASANATALNLAISFGGVINIGNGIIYTNGLTIKFLRGTRFKGQGMTRSAIVRSDSAAPTAMIDQSIASGAAVTDVEISDMRLSGGSVALQLGVAGGNDYAVKSKIKKVWLYNSGVGCQIYNGWENKFEACIFDSNTWRNLEILAYSAPAYENTNIFELCDFTNSSADFQVFISQSLLHTTKFKNCLWEGALSAATIALKVGSSNITGLHLDGCYFEDHDNYYISVPDSATNSNNSIKRCSFQDKSGRTAAMMSTLNGFNLEGNYLKADFGSAGVDGLKRCVVSNNRRTSSGTNFLTLCSLSAISDSVVMDDTTGKMIMPSYLIGSGTNGQTAGKVTDTKTVAASATSDLAQLKVSGNYSSAILDVAVAGRNASGTNVYFSGERFVTFEGAGAITTITLGTDTSTNCTLVITWVSNNTFKVSITNNTGSTCGLSFSVDVKCAGGNNGTVGRLDYLTVL